MREHIYDGEVGPEVLLWSTLTGLGWTTALGSGRSGRRTTFRRGDSGRM